MDPSRVSPINMPTKSTRSLNLTKSTTQRILSAMGALLGVREAANVLGVHENTLRRWAEKGYLKPVVNPSGVRRFRKDEIAQLRRRMYDGAGFATPRQSDDVVTVTNIEPVD